jgi:hypothetical protein
MKCNISLDASSQQLCIPSDAAIPVGSDSDMEATAPVKTPATTKSDEINRIYKSESSAVFRLRLVVFVATLLAAVGVSLAVFFIMDDTEMMSIVLV